MKAPQYDPAIHQLNAPDDPNYFGVYFTRYLFTVIGILFSILLAIVLGIMMAVEIELTAKANILAIEKCADRQAKCAVLALTGRGKEDKRVAVGNAVHIKVSSTNRYSRYMIEGEVISVGQPAQANDSIKVVVALKSSDDKVDELKPSFGLIVVDRQRVLDVLFEALWGA